MARTGKKIPAKGKVRSRISAAPGREAHLKPHPRHSTSEVRASFADALDISRTGKRRVFARYGKDVAVLVPMKDAALLQLLDARKHRKLRAMLLAELEKM